MSKTLNMYTISLVSNMGEVATTVTPRS